MPTHGYSEYKINFLLGAVLIVAGESMFAYAAYKLFDGGLLYALSLSHVVLAVVLSAGVLSPKVKTYWGLAAAFVAVMLPFFPITFYNHYLLATGDYLWAPFLGIKAIVVSLALVVPAGVAMNLVLIALFLIEVVALWFWLDLGANPMVAAAGEPWFTLIFFMVSAATLVFRKRSRRYAKKLAESEARTKALTEMAAVFINVRDRANTPLQNILTAGELLGRKHPEDADLVEPIIAGVDELHRLAERLRDFDPYARWESGIPVSSTAFSRPGKAELDDE